MNIILKSNTEVGDEYLGYSPSKQIYRVIDSKTGKEVSKTFNAMAQVYGSDWKEKINEGFTKGQKVTYITTNTSILDRKSVV